MKYETENNGQEVIKLNTTGASGVYEWIHTFLAAVVLVVVLLTFAFRLIDVDGSSMLPTLVNSDKVIVTNLFYEPKDGDVVVISHGADYDKPLIKRVIATEGQTLNIDFEKNEVYVDGVLIQEDYIQGVTIPGDAEIPSVIPKGKVFVMGDNRTDSYDSRYNAIGLIDEESIVGKASFVILPFSRFGTFD